MIGGYVFQVMQTKGSGYTLMDKGNGLWQLRTSKGIFTGSLKQVCKYSVIKLDFEIQEIEMAVLEMEKHFHNAAEFGVLKSFMWTFDVEEKNESFSTKH